MVFLLLSKFIYRFLHENLKMNLEQTNFDGKRPLHDAAQFSHLDCVEYLLNNGKFFTASFFIIKKK